jgi:hypothetical protein
MVTVSSSANSRQYRNISKSRSLILLCGAIKNRKVLFAKDLSATETDLGIPGQFLNLVTENRERTLQDIFVILKRQNSCDDFVHAVNFATVTLWLHTNKWPTILDSSELKDLQI